MKTRNLFTAATICAAMAFAACNANDDINDDNGAVRFTAGIDKQAVATPTRTIDQPWTSGAAIGIFMTQSGAAIESNNHYTTAGNGTFTAVTGDELYYPMDGSAVNFIAYYPYESGAAFTTPINVAIAVAQTAANQPTFDLLYSTGATGSKSNGTSPVVLTFSHKLAKIVMNTSANASVGAQLTGMTVTIKGMNTENTFDLSTGTLATASTPLDIAPRTITDGSSYDAIIMPDAYNAGDVTVEFTLADGSGDTFTWNVGAVTFEGGNQYAYTVTLTRTGVQVTGTITPWTNNNQGGVTAD